MQLNHKLQIYKLKLKRYRYLQGPNQMLNNKSKVINEFTIVFFFIIL